MMMYEDPAELEMFEQQEGSNRSANSFFLQNNINQTTG